MSATNKLIALALKSYSLHRPLLRFQDRDFCVHMSSTDITECASFKILTGLYVHIRICLQQIKPICASFA